MAARPRGRAANLVIGDGQIGPSPRRDRAHWMLSLSERVEPVNLGTEAAVRLWVE